MPQDKQLAIKSMIAAMNALSGIQQQKTKLLTTMLQGSERFRNNFMLQIAKGKMGTQEAVNREQALNPIKLQQKRDEAEIVTPAQEAQIKANEARTEYYKGGAKKQPTTAEKVQAKVAESGIESLTPGEKAIWNIVEKKGGKNKYTIDPEVTDRFYNNAKKKVDAGELKTVTDDLTKNFYKYQAAGVDAGGILNRIIKEPASQQPESAWSQFANFFKRLIPKNTPEEE